ncbi:hypothetical protein Tsubulata_024545 [Turnera subulata]|uniref:Tetratricopeptide SHNi-TPR domain-containing protein n=1 Tax=Turnera subulata TaxID=218843 RepID=A0A9Q0JK51_9ROSI|nr:hypothetical protein Tsubulata_024545 [Turnera subulata]
MAEETPESSSVTTVADQSLTNAAIEHQASDEATIQSAALGGTDSTCNTGNAGETSDSGREKSLEFAAELAEKGTKALKENDFAEAVDCFSRALEIRVLHHGELSPECIGAYYQYGRALLYKAQEEADPLGTVPKKENEAKKDGDEEGSIKNGESSTAASVSSVPEEGGSSSHPEPEGAAEDAAEEEDQGEGDEDSDDEDVAEGDEDESDLDLAWKMLDVARAIAEKSSTGTMDKVDILSALAEVALEREDIETSLSDYQKALAILETLVEPDNRYIAELYPFLRFNVLLSLISEVSCTAMPYVVVLKCSWFVGSGTDNLQLSPGILSSYYLVHCFSMFCINFRICLCLEIGSKPQEAIPYCQKAITVCKARLQRLASEVKTSSESATSSAASELDKGVTSSGSQTGKSIPDKEAEIETLSDLSGELEKKASVD